MSAVQLLGVLIGCGAVLLGVCHFSTYGYRPRVGALVPDGQKDRLPTQDADELIIAARSKGLPLNMIRDTREIHASFPRRVK